MIITIIIRMIMCMCIHIHILYIYIYREREIDTVYSIICTLICVLYNARPPPYVHLPLQTTELWPAPPHLDSPFAQAARQPHQHGHARTPRSTASFVGFVVFGLRRRKISRDAKPSCSCPDNKQTAMHQATAKMVSLEDRRCRVQEANSPSRHLHLYQAISVPLQRLSVEASSSDRPSLDVIEIFQIRLPNWDQLKRPRLP